MSDKMGKVGQAGWHSLHAIAIHSLLLILLALFLWFLPPVLWRLTGDMGTTIPWEIRQLGFISSVLITNPALVTVVVLVLLWADSKVYSSLNSKHGTWACNLWASTVALVIALVIVWNGYLVTEGLSWIAELPRAR